MKHHGNAIDFAFNLATGRLELPTRETEESQRINAQVDELCRQRKALLCWAREGMRVSPPYPINDHVLHVMECGRFWCQACRKTFFLLPDLSIIQNAIPLCAWADGKPSWMKWVT